MGKMKRFTMILLMTALLLGGCGAKTQNEESKTSEILENGQKQLEEGMETVREFYSVDGFENASREYDRFNSYAYENGLEGTLIFIEGKIVNQTQSGDMLSLIIEQEDGDRWVASILSNSEMEGIEGKETRIFGTYLGFSDVFNVPGMAVVVDDTDLMDKARMELKENRIWSEVWNFYNDYVKPEIDKSNNPNDFSLTESMEYENEEYNQEESSKENETSGAPTTGQRNALKSAKNYLSFTAFSYNGLIGQLEYEKYSHEDSVYAADNCGADWNEQALKSAKNYLGFIAFSYTGLIRQLEYEKFTTEQATYAADNCNADWNEQAAKCAENYLRIMSFSRDGLIKQLEYEGFTHEQAVYGAGQNGY